ncbi:MAG: carboxymuconolactone decarboxylase family protein [Pseudodesulfovibrio sp.]|uniref:carboxymuconolactone decarboxylase family protein n=1 Tax=Pseudodesulfovibrio sp. TaxID=2035812 RepID=UPI003D0C8E88
MFMIDYARPEQAEGTVKKVYSAFPPHIPVPDPIQLYSASPRYLTRQMAIAGDYMQDDAYSPELLAALRYIGASTACFGFCTTFNKGLLSSMGLSEAEIDALDTDPAKAFEPREAALLAFAAKSVKTPDSVTRADVDAVRAAGWSDPHIFEATAYAAQMATIGIVFRAFAEK